MSIQDNINEVKKEFTSDEQMLVQAFKLEKFYKKYKILILGTVALVVVFFAGRAIMDYMEERRLDTANRAYLALTKGNDDFIMNAIEIHDISEAPAILKENSPELFELYSYKKAIEEKDTKTLESLSKSKNEIIADIAAYHLSVLEGKQTQSKLYEEIAIVNNAHLLIKEGKISEANNQLAIIGEQSPVYSIANIIKHYSIKGK